MKRRDLVRGLRRLGFDGPYSGGRHQFMIKKNVTLVLPNPHQSDIGSELLARILRQAGISKKKWSNAQLTKKQGNTTG